MKESFQQVKELLDELGPFFIRAGISESRCKMPTGDINQIDTQKYIDAFDWLSDVGTSFEYMKVQEAWSLLPAKTWADYDLYGFSGMQEQRILNEALESFKPLWREKPSGFFGKHFDEIEETNEATYNSEDQ